MADNENAPENNNTALVVASGGSGASEVDAANDTGTV